MLMQSQTAPSVSGDQPVGEAAPALVVPVTEVSLESWLWLGGLALAAILAGIIAHALLFGILQRLAKRDPGSMVASVVKRLTGPSRLVLPLLALQFVLGSSIPGVPAVVSIIRLATVMLIMGITWAAVRTVAVLEDLVSRRHRIDVPDNYRARRVTTQVTVLGRVVTVILVLVGVATALMTFPQVRQVGASLLASAGIIGLIAGMAARPIVENLLAGIQIAFTEPIQIDDVVVIQGEWGRIEEITPTYIVVRIWDDRRLVVPLSYFITNPIENWTRRTAHVLGTVSLFADYTVPVPRVRAELERILNQSRFWDRRAWSLQVTNATANSVELRALMSAADGSTVFDLRCEVREKLIDFLQREFPGCLPRTRTEVEADDQRPVAAERQPADPPPDAVDGADSSES